MKVTISGSYRKYPEEAANVIQEFQDNGTTILSPLSLDIISSLDGFVALKGDIVEQINHQSDISEAMRIVENNHLKAITQSDLLWLTLTQGYIGPSTSFEMGWAIAHNIPVYAKQKEIQQTTEPLIQMYVNPSSSISYLAQNFDPTSILHIDPAIGRSIIQAAGYNSTIAVGAIAVDPKGNIVLVNDGHWNDQFTLPGIKRKPGERLETSLQRAIQKRLHQNGTPGRQICTFEELPTDKYEERVFTDYLVHLTRTPTQPNTIALPPGTALREIPIEPNARKTIEVYAA